MENTTSQTPQIKFQWWWAVLGVIAILAFVVVGGYNGLVSERAKVGEARSNLQSQYQRRSDLIPNIVSTVKGSADFEQSTLTQVVEARSKATSININTANTSPEDLKKFYDAQAGVSSALSRLLVVSEQYPDLKASQSFRDMTVTLEGTENRINTSRSDYNRVVKDYNVRVQTFPGSLTAGIFGFKTEALFEASAGAQDAPSVKFNFGSSSSVSR